MSTDGTGAATLSDRVAEEILGLMGRRRVNKAEMARRLGKKEDWVGRRLNGRQPLDVEDLQRFAVVLGVSVSDLFPRQPGDTRRYPGSAPQGSLGVAGQPITSDPLAPRLVATVGEPNRRPRPQRVGRGQRTVRLPRPGVRSQRRPVTPAVV